MQLTATAAFGFGVNVRCNTNSFASLTVNGGNLTSSGSPGLLYDTNTSSAPQTIFTVSDVPLWTQEAVGSVPDWLQIPRKFPLLIIVLVSSLP